VQPVAGDPLPRDIGDCSTPLGIQSIVWAANLVSPKIDNCPPPRYSVCCVGCEHSFPRWSFHRFLGKLCLQPTQRTEYRGGGTVPDVSGEVVPRNSQTRVSSLGLHKILFFCEAVVHESTIHSFPPPACIAHPGAILLHDYWAVYDSPSELSCVCYAPYNIEVFERSRSKSSPLEKTRSKLANPVEVNGFDRG